MIERGFFRLQHARGRGFRKLDEDRVRRIKQLLEAGRTAKEIAELERISESAVYDIRSGRNWSWVVP